MGFEPRPPDCSGCKVSMDCWHIFLPCILISLFPVTTFSDKTPSVLCGSLKFISVARNLRTPFTLHRYCTKTERKTSIFVQVFTMICTKRRKNEGFRKRYRNWISTKVEVFENALNHRERTKTEVFENAPIFNNELHRTRAM